MAVLCENFPHLTCVGGWSPGIASHLPCAAGRGGDGDPMVIQRSEPQDTMFFD